MDEQDGGPVRPAPAGIHGAGRVTAPDLAPGVAPEPEQQPWRRAFRRPDRGWAVGVAAGVADHLRIPVWIVRAAFVALAAFDMVGVLLYGALWILMPRAEGAASSPGIASADRLGLRTVAPAAGRSTSGITGALVLVGVGLVWVLQSIGLGIPGRWFWPLALAAGGVALVWRQADDSVSADHILTDRRWRAALLERSGRMAALRVGVGLALMGSAVSLVAASQIGFDQLPRLALMALLVLVGVGLVAAPWVRSWQLRLRKSDRERVVADARADMAAHLHDSVLQTLALIQRQADDPRAVSTLARRQERELREWLYGGATATASGGVSGSGDAGPTTLRAALTAETGRIEAERGTPVELVCVGDIDLDEGLTALVQAAAEAVMNAAKHSGAPKVDVYAEIEPDQVEVFVRDRGVGFDLDGIGDDRMGVRRSIIARMERHGGTATVRSRPGEGTEIRLQMRPGQPGDSDAAESPRTATTRMTTARTR
ncbi:MAG: PspC domain-containing protein [Acidipropionibacterium sp.]|jgi:signal transduction histidine kinase/phage shock protein PspC (stress-responsive transcriptional regulator)|nr:PspC domain-containing protein [Acidipropionibacterium sp.]